MKRQCINKHAREIKHIFTQRDLTQDITTSNSLLSICTAHFGYAKSTTVSTLYIHENHINALTCIFRNRFDVMFFTMILHSHVHVRRMQYTLFEYMYPVKVVDLLEI